MGYRTGGKSHEVRSSAREEIDEINSVSSEAEFEAMRTEIAAAKSYEAAGVILGILGRRWHLTPALPRKELSITRNFSGTEVFQCLKIHKSLWIQSVKRIRLASISTPLGLIY